MFTVPKTIQRDLVPSAANNVPISLDFVHCTKDSQGLKDCPAPTHVQQCTHVHDAGVSCPITSGELSAYCMKVDERPCLAVCSCG